MWTQHISIQAVFFTRKMNTLVLPFLCEKKRENRCRHKVAGASRGSGTVLLHWLSKGRTGEISLSPPKEYDASLAVGILLALLATHALQKGYFVLGTPITLNGAKKIKALSLPHRPTVTEANPSATNGKTGTARPLETEKRKHDAACMPQRQALHHPLLVAPRVAGRRPRTPAGRMGGPARHRLLFCRPERKKENVRPSRRPACYSVYFSRRTCTAGAPLPCFIVGRWMLTTDGRVALFSIRGTGISWRVIVA